jgi:hypothetical protein
MTTTVVELRAHFPRAFGPSPQTRWRLGAFTSSVASLLALFIWFDIRRAPVTRHPGCSSSCAR